jgi:hypothetical protein
MKLEYDRDIFEEDPEDLLRKIICESEGSHIWREYERLDEEVVFLCTYCKEIKVVER